jgi:S-adenosylmethionine synthetase
MHRVKFALAYKVNLGNFENVDVAVGLEQDGFGHPDVTMEKVSEWVADQLAQKVKDTVEAIKSSGDDKE